MSTEEIVEDILLTLLIYNVENKGKWMEKNILKVKVGEEELLTALSFLKEKNYVEFKDEEHLRITDDGIHFILERV